MAVPKRFSQWEEKAPKDYDPDADPPADSDSESDDEAVNLAGTEHYVEVGKSKLRQKDSVSLGPQYRGARVSRQALEDSEESQEESEGYEDAQEALSSEGEEEDAYDDPETADLAAAQARATDDAEIDSDNALVESDEEQLRDFVFRGSSKPRDADGKRKTRPVAADFISSSGEEDEEEGEEDVGGAGLLDTEAEEETDQSGSQDDDEEDDEEEYDDEMEDASDLDGFIVGDDESESEDEEAEEKDTDDGDDDDDDDDDEDESDEDDDPARAHQSKASKSDARAEQRRLMNEGQKALVASITAAAQQDAKKGLAVRQQRKVFDGLLNLRIRLQKALVATNSFSAFDGDDKDDGDEKDSTPYQAAEEAALQLLATLDSVRASIVPTPMAGEKRKRDTEDATSSEALWQDLQETEERASKQRKKVLETWANKTKSTTVEVKSRNLIASRQSLVATLEDQLVNSDRLLKRARTPRSCAPVQVAKKINEDATIYDDADFYQLLLKELVDQRTTEESSGAVGAGGAVATVRWAAAMKEAKVKKQVDRRASKGRKLRFNIHEKLQNFMAPEDRRTWEQDAVDRLFGTLFGQKMELTEGGSSDEEMDGVNAEEEGLRLFRN